MNRRSTFSLFATAALGLVLLPSVAIAQQKSIKEQLVGTWEITTLSIHRKDGKKIQPMTAHPKGIAVFTKGGRFILINTRPGRAKYASNSRIKGTAEENKATVLGSIGYFGTYSVNEAEKTYTVYIATSSYPNDEAKDSKRKITLLTEGELKFVNVSGSIGGAALHLAMKRVE